MTYRAFSFLFLLGLALVAYAAAPGDLDEVAFLACNAEVESAGRPGRIGTRGEVGRNQMMPATVRMYSAAPLGLMATDRRHALGVELAHLRAIRRGLVAQRFPVDAYHCALAWHAGLAATVEGKTRPRQRDHAQRVANLYAEGRP